jgi:hypothetical protein
MTGLLDLIDGAGDIPYRFESVNGVPKIRHNANAGGQAQFGNSAQAALPKGRIFRLSGHLFRDAAAGVCEARWYADPAVLILGKDTDSFHGEENTLIAGPLRHSQRCKTTAQWASLDGAAFGRCAVDEGGRAWMCLPSVNPNSDLTTSMSVVTWEDTKAEDLTLQVLSHPTAVGSTDDVQIGLVGGVRTAIVLHAGSSNPVISCWTPDGLDAAHSWTRAQLRASSSFGATLFPNGDEKLTRIVVVPGSSVVIALRAEPNAGAQVSHLAAIDVESGKVLIEWTWPGNPPDNAGNPRTIRFQRGAVSPVPGVASAAKFTYVASVSSAGTDEALFCVQEVLIDWTPGSEAVTAVSVPFTPDSQNQAFSVGYDDKGDLFVSTRLYIVSQLLWQLLNMSIYQAAVDGTHVYTTNPVGAWWSTNFRDVVAPDLAPIPIQTTVGPVGAPMHEPGLDIVYQGTDAGAVWPIAMGGPQGARTAQSKSRMSVDLSLVKGTLGPPRTGEKVTNPDATIACASFAVSLAKARCWSIWGQTDPTLLAASKENQYVVRLDLDELRSLAGLDPPGRPASETGADSLVPLESIVDTGLSIGSASVTKIRVGNTSAANLEGLFDDVAVSIATWLPPAV